MSRNRRRPARALAGVAGAVALTGLLVSGCGAGQIAQTAEQVAATNGLNTSVGDVDLRDVQVAYPPNPASPAVLYARGTSAPLRATLVNTGTVADRLVRVSSPAATSVAVGGDPVLPANVALVSAPGTPLAPVAARPLQIQLDGLTRPIAPGNQIPVTFVFERAGSVTVEVPTAVPTEGAPAAEPERSEAESGGQNGAETGFNAETGGQAEAPATRQPSPPVPGESGGQEPLPSGGGN